MTREDLYSTYADTIEAVIAAVCRRHRLPADAGEELASQIRLKLIDNDYAVLRRFQGRSSMRTYLITISERVLLDWRTREWGKWRPCQEARRLGPLAIELDRLLTREGLTFEEAAEALLTRGRAASRAELEAIRPRLADRSGRWMVSGDVLEHMPAADGAADERVLSQERRTRAAKASEALAEALRMLPPHDQVIVRLRFQDGFSVARIAELLGEDQKPLYRRFERVLARLRDGLIGLGITEGDAAELFAEPSVELAPSLTTLAGGNEVRGPSTRVTPGGRHA